MAYNVRSNNSTQEFTYSSKKTSLVEFLMTENVNQREELSHLTLLTISDFFLSQYSANHKIFMSKLTMTVIEKTSKLCGLMKSKYNIQNYHRYKTVSKQLESIDAVIYSLK